MNFSFQFFSRCSYGNDHRASDATMVADVCKIFRVRHVGSKLRRIGLLVLLMAGLCYLNQGPSPVHPSIVPTVAFQEQVIFTLGNILIKTFVFLPKSILCFQWWQRQWPGVCTSSWAWLLEAEAGELWSLLHLHLLQLGHLHSHLHSHSHLRSAPTEGRADET